jgi:hypothetical protein
VLTLFWLPERQNLQLRLSARRPKLDGSQLILNYPSSSVGATLKPAGLDKSVGVIVGTFTKDPTDTKWDKDKGMNDYRAFIDKYMPGVDISDGNYLFDTRRE